MIGLSMQNLGWGDWLIALIATPCLLVGTTLPRSYLGMVDTDQIFTRS